MLILLVSLTFFIVMDIVIVLLYIEREDKGVSNFWQYVWGGITEFFRNRRENTRIAWQTFKEENRYFWDIYWDFFSDIADDFLDKGISESRD